MMQKLGNEVTDAEIKDIITESGSSKASGITYPEFQKLMGMGIKNLREPEDPEDELRHAFRLFDQDGDGERHPSPRTLTPCPNPGRRRVCGTPPLLLRPTPRRPAALGRAPPPCRSHALPQHPPPSLPCRRLHLGQGARQSPLQLRRLPGDRQGGGAGHLRGDTQRRPQD